MKKIILILQLLCLLALSAFSQDEKADWKIFAPEMEEFSVEAPKAMITSEFIKKKSAKSEDSFIGRYRLKFNSSYFFVFSGDGLASKGSSLPTAFDDVALNEFIKESAAEKVSLEGPGFEGDYYTVKDDQEFYHSILVINRKKRSYIFHAVDEKPKTPDVERFFASIQFNEEKNNITLITDAPKPLFPPPSKPAETSGPELGGGLGAGKTPSDMPPAVKPAQAPAAAEAPKGKTSPLRLFSMPRALYTDLAREYEMAGVVRLRVVFKADGTIGLIAPFSKLPFGLTKSAIEAAKQIRFDPAVKDGVPQTIVKTVEYRFTIY